MNHYWSIFYTSMMNNISGYSYFPIAQPSQMILGGPQPQFYPSFLPEFALPLPEFELIDQPQQFKNTDVVSPTPTSQFRSQIPPEKQKQRIESDDEYRQRGQKSDRNIRSNAIKLFFKFIRNQIKYIQLLIEQILGHSKEFSNSNDFFLMLDNLFPVQKTYVRPKIFINICRGQENKLVCPIFSKTLRILFRHFLKEQAHQLWSKKYICNRKMLNVHLKACRNLLKEIGEPTMKNIS